MRAILAVLLVAACAACSDQTETSFEASERVKAEMLLPLLANRTEALQTQVDFLKRRVTRLECAGEGRDRHRTVCDQAEREGVLRGDW